MTVVHQRDRNVSLVREFGQGSSLRNKKALVIPASHETRQNELARTVPLSVLPSKTVPKQDVDSQRTNADFEIPIGEVSIWRHQRPSQSMPEF